MGQRHGNPTAMGMQIVITNPAGNQHTLWLPAGRPQGRFTAGTPGLEHFSIEGRNGEWIAACSGQAYFANCHEMARFSTALADMQTLIFRDGEKKALIYAETWSRERAYFQKYRVPNGVTITIGRVYGNDIQYDCMFASSHHATLAYAGGKWQLTDHDSLNGTFVNGKRIQEDSLSLGDSIYLSGLRIIIGAGFLAMNCRGREVTLNTAKLVRMEGEQRPRQAYRPPAPAEALFNRQPRRRQSLEAAPVVIEGPPMSANANKMPMLLRLGSGMVMGTTSLLAGRATAMLTSVLFPFLSSKYTDKERKEYEQRRVELYGRYLEDKRRAIAEEKEREESRLNQNYPDLQRVLQIPLDGKRLWERRPVDDDFLTVRVGAGDAPLLAEIQYPEESFSMDEDPLEKKMLSLARKPVRLEGAPIQVSLLQDFVCGITGIYRLRLEMVRNMILQIGVLHSYDEVKMVFLGDEQSLQALNFIRYLPHFWNDSRTMRFIALNSADACQISEYLKTGRASDRERRKSLKDILKERPYYVIFALHKRVYDSAEVLKDILADESSTGASVVAAFGDLPKECTKIIQMNAAGSHQIISLKQLDSENQEFRLDAYPPELAVMAEKKLAATQLKTISENFTLPKTYTVLEMFGVGKVEHLNVLKRWQDNNPTLSLAAPVGIGTDGLPFTLDLHQKYQGPHGLVAGMTGSGKSEFIITYILSMAVNYHPDEVAFILIDYKGGGLAGAFDDPDHHVRLPHLVGTITNLDGSAIQRSLLSIQSELTRRQRIFNEVKGVSNEGTMDIYSYQRLYRAGKVPEPLPHLFIVSDEFAELKQQKPEFMDNLVSAARIGRSLGVHLILATQKPSGVVNDQIRSNTKFRVCLKVQDKADSMDMLKRPDAAELKDTGRFYLQVGYNEYFALGQSAWGGADYTPQNEVVVQRDESIAFIDAVGQTQLEVKPERKARSSDMTQVVAIVRYLSELAQREHIQSRRLWLDPLPPRLALGGPGCPAQSENLKVQVGILDDPENQRQMPLYVDLLHSRHYLIVGGQGSGKTTLFQSILYSLARDYSPEQIRFYILGFSGKTLGLFKKLPHCGGVLGENEIENLDSFFAMINRIVESRKKLFGQLEVDNYIDANAIQPIPLVLVVIDNISGLGTTKVGENHVYKLQQYLKDSANYGVKYMISCNHLNDVSSRIKQELQNRICFRMKDKYDYGDALVCKVSYTPPDLPGRGLVCVEDRPLEFQAAMFMPDEEAQERTGQLKNALEEIAAANAACAPAQRLPVTAENAEYADFAGQFARGRIPLGYAKQGGKAVAIPLRQLAVLGVYFGNPAGTLPITENLLCAALRENMAIWIIRRKQHSLFNDNAGGFIGRALENNPNLYDLQENKAEHIWRPLSAEMAERRQKLEQLGEEGANPNGQGIPARAWFDGLQEKTRPMLLFIESVSDFCESLDGISELVFDKIFKTAKLRNIYIIACYAPTDSETAKKRWLYSEMVTNGTVMLFGGQFDRQSLCPLDRGAGQLDRKLPFNVCLMQYQGGYYPLVMPCGEISSEDIDEDAQSIF